MDNPQSSDVVLICENCAAKNLVDRSGLGNELYCGRCGYRLDSGPAPRQQPLEEPAYRSDIYPKHVPVPPPPPRRPNDNEGWGTEAKIVMVTLVVIGILGYFLISRDEGFKKQAAKEPTKREVQQRVPPSEPKPKPKPRPRPKPKPLLHRKLPNGTMVLDGKLTGLGELVVDNGLAKDAVVMLVDTTTDKPLASFYASGGREHRLKKINNGVYKLIFATGEDWDAEHMRFTRKRSFSEFRETIDYYTTKKRKGNQISTEYRINTVTLHPVKGGNAKTDNIYEKEFLKYMERGGKPETEQAAASITKQ